MSKRSEEAALKAYPKENGKVWSSAFGTFEFDKNAVERKGYQEGYEQAEKDTIARAAKWIMEFENQLKVIFRITDTEFLEQFRKEMEEK